MRRSDFQGSRRRGGGRPPALRGAPRATSAMFVFAVLACGSAEDERALLEPLVGEPDHRPAPYLLLPPEATSAPELDDGTPSILGFPLLLSETGAFEDTAALIPAPGLIPYEIQVPLWSDGAVKLRWIAVPEGVQLGYSRDGAWQIPEGTVFVKHFEMAMDERTPEQRRRLETRLWVMGRGGMPYGVSYRWNAAQTDAELFVDAETEELSIVDAGGETRTQSYLYPSANNCFSCHSEAAGHVLGIRAWQLNREIVYRPEVPPLNQLVAWSGWGLLDAPIDNTGARQTPRLAELDDSSESLEHRVRSYWDGNCSMCHAGSEGTVVGWDARITTPLSEQGLTAVPTRGGTGARHLITPGDPEGSLIYQRGESVERDLRMPPLGRDRADELYIDTLAQWIASLDD